MNIHLSTTYITDFLNQFHLFDIAFSQLNLFSFMLGMSYAFFNQGLFGKNIGKYVFLYFAGLALWYWALYYAATHP